MYKRQYKNSSYKSSTDVYKVQVKFTLFNKKNFHLSDKSKNKNRLTLIIILLYHNK